MSVFSTEHDSAGCDLCGGAVQYRDDHYALGRFRVAVARETGLARDAARQQSIESLARRLQAKRAADTATATRALLALEGRL